MFVVVFELVFRKQRILPRSIYMMLIYESHVFELRVETKFEVCDPRSFFFCFFFFLTLLI